MISELPGEKWDLTSGNRLPVFFWRLVNVLQLVIMVKSHELHGFLLPRHAVEIETWHVAVHHRDRCRA